MNANDVRIFPLGDSALTVEFGRSISVDVNRRAIALAEHFSKNPFPGFIESVPAYSSASVFYDLVTVSRETEGVSSAFDVVANIVRQAISAPLIHSAPARAVTEIPVYFDASSALDLDLIAESSGLAPDEVTEIFLLRTYHVFMIGFLPGFPYMGEVDDRIVVPRKRSPRANVPKGSVGIAGAQTGIYPQDSPGGWQIIGRTEMEMFTPGSAPPTALEPGDNVRFLRAK